MSQTDQAGAPCDSALWEHGGPDPEPNTILFGGVLMLVEPKCGSRTPPEVAERQRIDLRRDRREGGVKVGIQSRYHNERDAAELASGALVYGSFSGRKGVLSVVEYLGTYPDGTVLLNAEEGGEGGPLMRAVVVRDVTPVDDLRWSVPTEDAPTGSPRHPHDVEAVPQQSECCGAPCRTLDNNGESAESHTCTSCGNGCDTETVSPGTESAPYRGGPKRG